MLNATILTYQIAGLNKSTPENRPLAWTAMYEMENDL